jgi:di/tricarboxylate transporter
MIAVPILLTLCVVVLLFVAFAKQILPAELSALAAVGVLLVTGVLNTNDLLFVFSNPAAMTVAAMFVLSAALEKTGVIDHLGKRALALSDKNGRAAVGIMFALVFIASFFVNNTSVVLIMIPVVTAVAHNLALPASKMLIPLSYVSILGGTCTLIGASTNLLVDGTAQSLGVPAFGMFEIFIPGLMIAAVGVLYLLSFGKKLLPERKSLSEFFDQKFERRYRYIVQIPVTEESGLAEKTLKDAGFTEENGYRAVHLAKKPDATKKGLVAALSGSDVAAMFREKMESHSYADVLDPETRPEIGDRLVVLTGQRQALTHDKDRQERAQRLKEPSLPEEAAVTVEGIVPPKSGFIGQFIHRLHLDELYDVHILAVHRNKGKISLDFDKIRLAVGDTLLLRGRESELKRVFDNDDLANLTKPSQEPFRQKKAPLAIAALGIAVAVAAFKIMPIAGASFAAAVFVTVSGCLKKEDAYKAVHAPVLLLIYAMLAISLAMENAGALKLIVDSAMALLSGLPPFVVVSLLYLLTSAVTEIFSNNAAAVMLTPIAVGVGQQMEANPKAFAAAIMFGASASFATPVGYQTNTLVFNAGGYRFTDYLRIGLPMNILMWLAASLVIGWYWGL